MGRDKVVICSFDPGPLWSAGVLENDTKPEPACTMHLCTIDILGMGLVLFIETCSCRGHLSDACQHQSKLHYLMNRNRKAPSALPLVVSE